MHPLRDTCGPEVVSPRRQVCPPSPPPSPPPPTYPIHDTHRIHSCEARFVRQLVCAHELEVGRVPHVEHAVAADSAHALAGARVGREGCGRRETISLQGRSAEWKKTKRAEGETTRRRRATRRHCQRRCLFVCASLCLSQGVPGPILRTELPCEKRTSLTLWLCAVRNALASFDTSALPREGTRQMATLASRDPAGRPRTRGGQAADR